MSDITRVLDRAQQGDPKAAEELFPLVYDELRRLAAHKMANEAPGQTLQPTALVHEAWLRLAGSENQVWRDRRHFFAAAAEAMRREGKLRRSRRSALFTLHCYLQEFARPTQMLLKRRGRKGPRRGAQKDFSAFLCENLCDLCVESSVRHFGCGVAALRLCASAPWR